MSEKPILFNAEMVRAILDGTKTQARRPIKKCPPGVDVKMMCHNEGRHNQAMTVGQGDDTQFFSSPFGLPGDTLWVRETFAYGSVESIDLMEGERERVFIEQCGQRDAIPKDLAIEAGIDTEEVVWTPSIHMPRHASRINLEVKRVWVERLQDISEEDAKAEGVACRRCDGRGWYLEQFGDNHGAPCDDCLKAARLNGHRIQEGQYAKQNLKNTFNQLWDSIYAKDGYGWDADPPVFCCEFEKL